MAALGLAQQQCLWLQGCCGINKDMAWSMVREKEKLDSVTSGKEPA